MSPKYLLDTNILSDVIRHPRGSVAARVTAAGEQEVCTSTIVAAELRFGADKSGSRKLEKRVDTVLSTLDVLHLAPPADRHYARIRWHLSRHGTLIGSNDMLIAAQALALDLTVVTGNFGEFSRVPGLKVEDWLVS